MRYWIMKLFTFYTETISCTAKYFIMVANCFVPKWKEQDSQCTHNVTLSRVRATLVAMEEQ